MIAPVSEGPVSRYMPRRTPAPIRYVAVAADRFIQQQMATYAAALAYRGLLALFPFVIFITALVNALDVWRLFGMLAEWARTAPEGRVPAAIREWIVFQARSRAEGAVLSVSAVAAAWAVASGARVLRTALNTAGNLSEVQPPLLAVVHAATSGKATDAKTSGARLRTRAAAGIANTSPFPGGRAAARN